MSFELRNIPKEENMTTEEKQQYFEQLCQMDEEDLRKLFENSNLYIKLKNLTERYAAARQEKPENPDLISRKELLHKIGVEELVSCLSTDDVINCNLFFDGELKPYFTGEQGRVLSAMCIAVRKFIADFPGAESNVHNNQYTGIIDKNGKKIYVGNTVDVYLNEFKEDTGTVIFQDGAYGVKFNHLYSKVPNQFMSFHALKTCYKGKFEIINQ